jgi:succinate dehydrogenase/fumarate reductase iron-sulfur protein
MASETSENAPAAGKARTVKVECFRFNPERDASPHFETYEVPVDGETRVTDCLDYIREYLDPSLAFFVNCKRGTCARCSMRINGKVQMACLSLVEGDCLRVEPLKPEEVIRDLWVKTI